MQDFKIANVKNEHSFYELYGSTVDLCKEGDQRKQYIIQARVYILHPLKYAHFFNFRLIDTILQSKKMEHTVSF